MMILMFWLLKKVYQWINQKKHIFKYFQYVCVFDIIWSFKIYFMVWAFNILIFGHQEQFLLLFNEKIFPLCYFQSSQIINNFYDYYLFNIYLYLFSFARIFIRKKIKYISKSGRRIWKFLLLYTYYNNILMCQFSLCDFNKLF